MCGKAYSSTDRKIVQDILSLSKYYSSSCVRMLRFVKAIVMDDGPVLDPTKDELVASFEELKVRVEHAERYESESLGATYAFNDAVDHFAARVLALCRNRSFFETVDGRLGVGPAYVKEGNLIFTICGLQAPFVIRQSPSVFAIKSCILMGDCYATGLMAIDWMRIMP